MEYPGGFCGGSYEARAFSACNTRTVNLYVEDITDPAGNTQRCMLRVPGVEELSSLANGPGRAHFYQAGREFAVIGSKFVEISTDGLTITEHGTVTLDGNPATISSNGDAGGELFITSGADGYLFTLATDTFATIAALADKATTGDYMEGYFFALDTTNGTVYASELNDGATWNTGTSFAQRSLASDPWIGMKVAGRTLWLLGSQTGEGWYNRGTSPFPLEPHPSALIQHGVAAPFSPANVEGSLIFLAASKIGEGYVVKTEGYSAIVISTQPLQDAINRIATISDAVGDGYNEGGHTFYILSIPASISYVWDNSTALWCERGTWISEDNEYVSWRPRWHVLAFDEHRWLDSETGAVYHSSQDLQLDVDERPLRWMRRAPAIIKDNLRITYHGLELLMDVGLGTSTGQGADPQLMGRFSRDGGRTWGPEMWRSAGKIGEYNTRPRWDRIGQARHLVFEIAGSDPAPTRISAAFLTPDPEVEGGEKAA